MIRIALVFLVWLSACSSKTPPVAVDSTLTFDQLPKTVQDAFLGYNQFSRYKIGDNDVLNFDTGEQYDFEVKRTGPWTDYFLLVNNSRNRKYKISQGEAFPFIIYNRSLFIATSYNLANSDEALKASFKKFKLD